MVIGYRWIGVLVDAAGQPLPGASEALRRDMQEGTQTFVLLDLAGSTVHRVIGTPRQPAIEEAVARFVAGLAALAWQPTLVIAATWPGEETRHWQLADERLWPLAAATVAQQLQLLWPSLTWPSGAPQLAVSAAADWKLPQPGMFQEVSRQLGVAHSELRVVGGLLERQAVKMVGGEWVDATVWLPEQ